MTNARFLPVHRISLQFLLFLFLVSSCLSMIRADQSKTSTLDKNTIYRLDLFTETLKTHSKKDLKPGAVYFRFSPLSGHHVWSRFSEKRIFEFAMGPGSVQPAWRFEIKIPPSIIQKFNHGAGALNHESFVKFGRTFFE